MQRDLRKQWLDETKRLGDQIAQKAKEGAVALDREIRELGNRTQDRFPLAESDATRSVSVSVDGVEQPPTAYLLDGGALVFTGGAVGADATVHVVYEYVAD